MFVCVLDRRGTVALIHIIIHITYKHVVFDGLRRRRFSPSRIIDPLASSSSQQCIIIIYDASAQRTWLARVPKIPEGFSKPVFVYSRFGFLVVVNNIRTVAAGSTCVFHSIFHTYGCIQNMLIIIMTNYVKEVSLAITNIYFFYLK